MDKRKSYNAKEFLYGVCYYPEHWEQSIWEQDFARIKELGMNVVRMGEGAWNVWEPEEGRYSFELFDKAVELCEKYGIKVIMGTPTYAPPAWLTHKYPEVLRVNFNGVPMQHGSRRHYNYTSPVYLELCREVITALAEHYKDNPNIIGWQLDNEFNCHMDVSFAESDHVAFRKWCKDKYTTLENLNKSWGTSFWAQTYTDWEQVYLPRPTPTYHNPSHLLDFFRFTSDTTINFAKIQHDILKNIAPHQFITHNGLFGNIDNQKLTDEALDFMSYDSYPAFSLHDKDLPYHYRTRMCGLNLSKVRGYSDKFIILEQQAGAGGQSGSYLIDGVDDYLLYTPKPGQMRLWAWQSVANGADGLLFFRWRTCPYGSETLWHGLNYYGNQPNRRLDEAKKLGEDFKAIGKIMLESRVKSCVALMYDYDNESNCKIEGYIGGYYWKTISEIYRALNERHITCDNLSQQHLQTDLSKYKVLFYPCIQLLDESDVEKLSTYVEGGGTLVLGPRSGYKNRTNQCYMLPFPGVLKELTGIEVVDFTMVSPEQPVAIEFCGTGYEAEAKAFNEVLKLERENVEIVARYKSDYYAGEAAVVCTPVGNGRVIYSGTFLAPESASLLLDYIGLDDPLNGWAEVPVNVEVIERQHNKEIIRIFLNYSDVPQKVVFMQDVENIMTSKSLSGIVEIEAFGVLVVK